MRPGIVALSRDLLREYTAGAPFGFGDRVEVVGVGKFLVEDTMASRFHKRVDIWFATRGEAQRWGKRRHVLRAVPAATPDDLVWGPPRAPVDLPPGALFQPALSE